jgi:integrase
MPFSVGHLSPVRGKVITTRPLTDIEQVREIKRQLEAHPRDYALFVLSVNSAFRASDLINLTRFDALFRDDGRCELVVKERKTGKNRKVLINTQAAEALRRYLDTRKDTWDWLFVGQRGQLTRQGLGQLVKKWFALIDVTQNVACHSLRKTWVRLQVEHFGVSLHTLMHALNHSSERQTLQYCGLLAEDVARLYENEL